MRSPRVQGPFRDRNGCRRMRRSASRIRSAETSWAASRSPLRFEGAGAARLPGKPRRSAARPWRPDLLPAPMGRTHRRRRHRRPKERCRANAAGAPGWRRRRREEERQSVQPWGSVPRPARTGGPYACPSTGKRHARNTPLPSPTFPFLSPLSFSARWAQPQVACAKNPNGSHIQVPPIAGRPSRLTRCVPCATPRRSRSPVLPDLHRSRLRG